MLYEKLRNKNRKDARSDDQCVENLSDFSAEEDELLSFFKNCVVRLQIDELKEKLACSVDIRRRILREPPEPIHKMFGFYFIDPELVLMEILFKT